MRSRRPVGATGFGLLAECPVAGVFCEQARLRDAKSRDAGAQSWMCISYEAKHPSSIPVVVARCDNSGIVNHSQPPEPWPVQLWSLRDRQECAALTSPMIARAEMQVLSAVVLRWFQVLGSNLIELRSISIGKFVDARRNVRQLRPWSETPKRTLAAWGSSTCVEYCAFLP